MRRRIRKQTIELDHIRNRIEPLTTKVEKLRVVRTHDDIHRLHAEISEILHLYNEELHNLKHIMHESDVIIRRTEKLFKAIEQEAEPLGMKMLNKDIKGYAKKFKKLLLDIAYSHKETLTDDDHLPWVRFTKFADSALEFKLYIWVDDLDLQWRVASELREIIHRRFKEEGIEIPFPQRDLHMKDGEGHEA